MCYSDSSVSLYLLSLPAALSLVFILQLRGKKNKLLCYLLNFPNCV